MSQTAFNRFSHKASRFTGAPQAFVIAVIIVGVWFVTGPMFQFSATWQLVINTATTIVTFLMVFLIQNTQNRDTKAIHLKLDELIRSSKSARNLVMNAEELNDQELDAMHQEFENLQNRAERELRRRGKI